MEMDFLRMAGSLFVTLVLAGSLASIPVRAAAQIPAGALEYRQEMVQLLVDIHQYAQRKNTAFFLLSNNGLPLLNPAETPPAAVAALAASLDGVLIESCHYGWELKDDVATPPEEQASMRAYIQYAKLQQLPVFNIDYCFSRRAVRSASSLNRQDGLVGFAAPRRQLDTIPAALENENAQNCRSLRTARNFLVLLNPERFATRAAYLAALQATNYDLLIVDLIYGDAPLQPAEVQALKKKANGGKRLVFAYMSVGEAETYRPYWQTAWEDAPPAWLAAKNEDWVGSYKVKYWTREWRALLYGSQSAYLDQILAAGFDGAFLDVVDAYDYFSAASAE